MAIALVGMAGCWALAAEQETVGKVVAIRGRVVAVQPGAAPRVLALKAPVFLKDTIETAKGRLQIMFTDNTLMTLGRNASMVLEDYLWAPGSSDSRLHTRIRAGSFRVMGGAITRDAPQNFKTEAPSATIGIRGSMYAGLVQGNRLSVVYQGGRGIYVSNPQGRVDIDRPGFGTRVSDPGQAPAPPEKFDETMLEEIEGGMAGASPEDAADEQAVAAGDGQDGEAAGTGGQEDAPEPADTGEDSQDDTMVAAGEEDSAESSFASGDAEFEADTPGQPDTLTTPPQTVEQGLVDNATDTVASDAVGPNEQAVLSLLAELGFSGPRSTTVPSSGIWTYTGIIRDNEPGEPDDDLMAHVNWHNRRLIAFENDSAHPHSTAGGFGIAQITGTGVIQNFRLYGSGDFGGSMTIYAFTGKETFGQVYGSAQEAAGMTIEGIDYPLSTPPGPGAGQTWSDTVAVTFDKISTSPDPGNSWNGFFMGLGENMNNIDTGRVAFVNDLSSEFTVNFNRTAGTVSGTMYGDDFLSSPGTFVNLTIGGTSVTDSAYISDDRLGAAITGTMTNGSGSTALKPWGNFMVSSMEAQLSDHTYWGYWEAAYSEPGSSADFHVHVPGSLWIAGDQTPAAQVQNLMTASFTATYTGHAKGIMIDPGASQQVSQLTNGVSSLNVDFGAETISGSISFTEVTLPVTVAAAEFENTGFTGTISGATASNVAGTFYGPNADAVGGNFAAEISTIHYLGIFAGDRP